MHAPFFCPKPLWWRWRRCIDLRLLNVWNGCRVGAPWTNSAYVCISIAWIRVIGDRWSIIKVVVIQFSSCAVPTRCNDNDGSVLILVDWMYATVLFWRWTNSWYVRIAACALEFGGAMYWWSIQYEVVISPSYIHHTLQSRWRVCIDLHVCNASRFGPGRTARTFIMLEFTCYWCLMARNLTLMSSHAFVEYMERVSYWPSEQIGRTLILLELGGVTGGWCSMIS